MKNRIARTIVGVTALIIVLLGVPLAIVTQRFYESRATVELQRSAAQAIAELTLPLDPAAIADAATEPDAPDDFSVYDRTGIKLYGTGPDRLDGDNADQLVVVSPITDRDTEVVVGTVRVSRPRSEIDAEVRRAWALMALAALGGLGVAIFIARWEAARLAAPIADLAARAERIGSGGYESAAAPTGVAELDTLATALAVSTQRLDELVTREREFSANASHQLRTPLAGLRVSLDRGDVTAAAIEADRLAATVDHMLSLARDSLPVADLIALGPIVDAATGRWQRPYTTAGRQLDVVIGVELPAIRARRGSIEQAIDVLLDNSLRYGAGTTRVTARVAPGGVVVQVDDDGPGIEPARVVSIFDRHDGTGTGIGLSLARTLVEADGGRLLLADADHAEFRMIFAASMKT